jgi:UDP-N-acetylglucosamine--N-acetylmuramyl-(pentapeptide) pyrophosphoryl-undecaprenol N-acetylglucosamine transferase
MPAPPKIAIACGGTGGHLFPGLAVADELAARGIVVALLISPKEVDQQAVKSIRDMEIVSLPAVGLTRGHRLDFFKGFLKTRTAAKKLFAGRPPQAVLAMGGFTSAPPILAGKSFGAFTFLHESNAIPGRANRLLAHVVDQAFVGFPQAAGRLHHHRVLATGTPVRPQFEPADAAACRVSLGLDPKRPVLLVTGGSQGAGGVNRLVLQALPELARRSPALQFLHLTGPNDFEEVQTAYRNQKCQAVARPFLTEMELALGAATLAVSRAGGSSLAELAAMRLPAILLPYPAAADNHQFYNARAFADDGASILLEEKTATGSTLAEHIVSLIGDTGRQTAMRAALSRWHTPHAASMIAENILAWVNAKSPGQFASPTRPVPAAPASHTSTVRLVHNS